MNVTSTALELGLPKDWTDKHISTTTEWAGTDCPTVTDFDITTSTLTLNPDPSWVEFDEDWGTDEATIGVKGIGRCTFRELKAWLENRAHDLPKQGKATSLGVHVV
jgi:hypothetical protein